MADLEPTKIEAEVDMRDPEDEYTLEQTPKSTWQRTWPIIACGAGLFSDGYINGVSKCHHSHFLSSAGQATKIDS